MRICADHWALMRAAVGENGMTALVAPDGETAHADLVAELRGESDPDHKRFDPLMSMHWHWTSHALRTGGLYLLMGKEDGTPYCPVCEFAAHYADFDPAAQINQVAVQMADYCRTEGLIAKLQ